MKGISVVGFALVAALAVSSACAEECTKEHPKVGSKATLTTIQYDVSGVLEIIDDCTFKVNLTYTAQGPDVFWYGADTKENLASGFILEKEDGEPFMMPRSHGPYKDEEQIVKLPEKVTWDDVNAISVWCRAFAVDFGNAVFPEVEDTIIPEAEDVAEGADK
ncbi:hypothetical protein BSKO_07282 [Bryopsis sp. KO-2023]|nr:hypothetical protein BSKO_07282 [Bryopsis sp. KO-2023]